ncbi:MAG TPA: class I SAM-dependent methyltransferase [Gammaproteobacteria bacterium]|nr:class I SAM-dependent methyltransferase [Gammaproteobacteria bacterium]
MKRVFLKPGREKSLLRRHPWVFSGAIERVEGSPAVGETMDVVASTGEFLARGAYSPASQIRLRVWTFDEEESVDEAFIARRLARAVESRERLGLVDPEGACRLVFAESDGLPGLVVDRYADFVVCQFLSAGADSLRATIAELLEELSGARGVYERSEASSRKKEGLPSLRGTLRGADPPAAIEVRSGDARFLVDVVNGQKTGAYLDQQANRRRVASYALDADVLDAFAYTGGFAISALKAGAASAVLVDSSEEALRLADRETVANGVGDRCRFVVANVFDELRVLREAGESYDLVILDPPKFVHSAEQVNAGSRGYKDVNMLGLSLVRPGGVLATFSCSGHVDAALFQKIVAGAALDAGRDAQIIERLAQPPDHPVALEFPEAEYLKGLVLRVH